MLADILLTLGGFALLVWGADRFVAGASTLANHLGVPHFLIGLTIVGFATSAPEIMVSASAATQGLTGMAVGNAIGSNIANIGLVLGATAILRPFSGEPSKTLTRQVNAVILISVLAAILFVDNELSRGDGILLICALGVFLIWTTYQGKRDAAPTEAISEIQNMSFGTCAIWLVIGFAILLIGANLLVTGAESLARTFGVSELVIGLSVVAIGTSLPELAISIISVFKNESGIAVGNIIGSNVFNLLAVIGVAGVIHPAALDPSVLQLHYPVMMVLTLTLLRIAYNGLGNAGMGRFAGFVLLGSFVTYQAVLLSGSV
jgi:cation:H+ antiporter